ncbi:MAG: hypothetical protein ACRDGS_13640, partial [Chloroflexota bacterium]
MATSFADFVAVRKSQETLGSPGQPRLYAHPTDSTAQRLLKRIGLHGSVVAVIESYLNVLYGTLIHDSVQESPRQFPELYALLSDCADRL